MTVLLRKEVRSLFPAWIMSIAAAALIGFVRPNGAPVLLFLVGIGSLLLGITSLGSEFSHGTFSLLLAQPIAREKIWRTKVTVLGAALLSIAIMVLVAFVCLFIRSSENVEVAWRDMEMFVIFTLLFFGAAFAGGLFSALTARQMGTAFWIALLFPFAVCGAVGILTIGRSDNTVNNSIAAALAVYDVAAFLVARHQFLRAQDLPGASGTVLSLPAWMRFRAKTHAATTAPSRRPLRALIAKEFQLHQVSLCFGAVLFLLHIITLVIRRIIFVPAGQQKDLYEILGCWWVLWFVLPAVIAGTAVAEERRQGTLEGSLCLVVKKRTQWFIKCAVCFFLGVSFGGAMPWLLETAAQLSGRPSPILQDPSPFPDHWHFLGWTLMVASIITLIAFYASSLARNLLQAIGVAVLVSSVFGWFVVETMSVDTYYLQDDSALLGYFLQFGLPALFALLLWLSYTNFRHLTVGWRLWLDNAFVLLFVVFLVSGSALHFAQASRPKTTLPTHPGFWRQRHPIPVLPPRGFFHTH